MSALGIEGVLPHEFGVFVRSEAELDRARSAVIAAGLPFKVLDSNRRDDNRPGLDQHYASGQRAGVPRRRGHGL